MLGFKKSSIQISRSKSGGSETPTSPTSKPEEQVPLPSPPPIEKTKSKSESKSSKSAKAAPAPDPVRTEEYILAAEERMSEIETLLAEIRLGKSKMSHEVARKIFQAVGSAMPVLQAVASLHPISSNVFQVFQGVYSLEKMRQDHDEDIAGVFYSATIAIWSLHHLAKLTIETDMQSKFEGILKKVEATLSDFGQYAVKFYSQNKAVRLVTIHGASATLDGFKGEFDNQKVELQWFLDTHTAVSTQRGLVATQSKLDKVLNNLAESNDTVKTLVEAESKRREQLSKMQQNMNVQFSSIITAIKQSNAESRDAILKRLDEGPHELIKDMGMKTVWKEMKWRNTIKCRHFVDAVQDYFFTRFAQSLKATDNFHQDQWTLHILSKSIFYPGIGDAIDGDSSGFVSVTELNEFLDQRPETWSVPEWLAFWAAGWSQCNMTYRTRIHDKWKTVRESIQASLVNLGQEHELARFLTDTEQFLRSIVGGPDEDYEEELLGSDVEVELFRLNTKYRRLQDQTLGDQLAINVIEEQEDVVKIIGQPRIELSLLPLLYVWISSIDEKLKSATAEGSDPQKITVVAHEYTIARKTFEDMVNRRLGELIQIWSQQKHHLSTQVSGFCGGIFEIYYETVYDKMRTEKKVNKLSFVRD